MLFVLDVDALQDDEEEEGEDDKGFFKGTTPPLPLETIIVCIFERNMKNECYMLHTTYVVIYLPTFYSRFICVCV